MDPETVFLTFSLAPGVGKGHGKEGADRSLTDNAAEQIMLKCLAKGPCTEAQLVALPNLGMVGVQASECCAALLFRLDQKGALVRTINHQGRPLVSCIPYRARLTQRGGKLPKGPLRLSPHAITRAQGGDMSIETAGAWARITIHDRDLFPLLHDVAAGRSARDIAAAAPAHSEGAVLAVLELMETCDLFDQSNTAWPQHDLLLHTRTRDGYGRGYLGKTSLGRGKIAPTGNAPHSEDCKIIALDMPDAQHQRDHDPSFATVSQRRRSIREQGADPLDMVQLSEFLFRAFFEHEGHRPYPSGGGCYPLTIYLAVDRCAGLAPGLYSYHPVQHHLRMVAENQTRNKRLLSDAAGRAGVKTVPQVLVIMAAHFDQMHTAYGDLSYSLILKEVGAVIQMAMLSGSAMGLATCPLGSGNSPLFSEIAGVDPLCVTSVGELMLGSYA